MVAERVYILSELGKRRGSDAKPEGRDPIIDYIYSHRTVRLGELSSMLGQDEMATRQTLRPYLKRGLIQELTQ